jgi:K(+)-stimulated pyrophosphate-energized sodium pump
MLLGVIVTGLFVAISMTAGGGAWDNAKDTSRMAISAAKAPTRTRRRSPATRSAILQATPPAAVNPMIKITNIVALLLLAVLAH